MVFLSIFGSVENLPQAILTAFLPGLFLSASNYPRYTEHVPFNNVIAWLYDLKSSCKIIPPRGENERLDRERGAPPVK
jgi:hypothetical protein